MLADEAEVEDLDVAGELVQTGEDARKGLRELFRRSMPGESSLQTSQRHGDSQQGMITYPTLRLYVLMVRAENIQSLETPSGGREITRTRPTLTSPDRPYSVRRYYVLTNAGKPVFTS